VYRFLSAVMMGLTSPPVVIAWFLLFLVMSNWATDKNWIWWWAAPIVVTAIALAIEARVYKNRHRRRP